MTTETQHKDTDEITATVAVTMTRIEWAMLRALTTYRKTHITTVLSGLGRAYVRENMAEINRILQAE